MAPARPRLAWARRLPVAGGGGRSSLSESRGDPTVSTSHIRSVRVAAEESDRHATPPISPLREVLAWAAPAKTHRQVAVAESLRASGTVSDDLGTPGTTDDLRGFQSLEARRCARAAGQTLGLRLNDLPRRDDGAPVWPRGCTGSLTHTAGYCAAVVSTAPTIRAIGVDAEWTRPFSAHMHDLVVRSDDSVLDQARKILPWDCAATAVFSAKESVYKALAQDDPGWIGFLDCRLEAVDSHQFIAHVERGDGPIHLRGAWRGFSQGGRTGVLTAAVAVA